ncbi:katanin p80 WD40 repeat-containing subunit B1 homolog KTN80.2-like isoform X2 [Argentina anserina]|uniref:katanin p80 WD40 repeat-containing subunit B1 homolog KTN80.2-like isoform X2 n=1 Tax=Argentina anserina TaxID=57926 RepID=UPI0021762E7A|nr:katanin p80 WD40 repeat-containing subunit B1 homolog KTN80.2-like isoform X2 [Potentilla anserina]
MAKRAYKLQEFVAHSDNINCLNIGKKACRLYVTGGDDHKVNLWTIGKPTALMSLTGHTSPVESVAFNSAEVLVLAGASTGATKIWDLEEAKMVRTLTGHRSSVSAVEFHPFGEFFASGSMDTNLKIWDIRKKGCIHTYKGHTQGISTIRFTPDGRWVVSGGFDNVVKVWDLTAGKLLHDFKFHEGHIRSIDFHPLEFLLATGSADRTVKFWDLETFELIGSTRPEPTGVRSITFHPDGRTIFSGSDDSLKVYSWEPVISHDSVDMGWSRLADLCIHDGKLLGCSYYRNSIGVWVADVSLIKPYGAGSTPEKNDCFDEKSHVKLQGIMEKVETGISGPGLRCMSPDYDSKEVKNIYVDCGKPITSQRINSSKVLPPLDLKETSAKKQIPAAGLIPKSNEKTVNKSLVMPNVVPRISPNVKDSANSGIESVAFSKTRRGMLLRPAHVRSPSNSKVDMEKLPLAVESLNFSSRTINLDDAGGLSSQIKSVSKDSDSESCKDKHSAIKSVEEKFEAVSSLKRPSDKETRNGSLNNSKESPVKVVNGVAVVSGRTRTLVERFERRERFSSDDDQATGIIGPVIPECQATSVSCTVIPDDHASSISSPVMPEDQATSICSPVIHEMDKTFTVQREEPHISGRDMSSANNDPTEDLMQTHDAFLSTLRSRLTKLQVVRHFWERNDIKGAISAIRKLPDHAVQADVISVLLEKMDILTLDLFSCLLPVLLGLLDSKIERHANVSLEMLLKLVAVFGPVIRSTISAPPAVGVNLVAEQRLECCKQCFIHLQKIQKILPVFVRKGGVLARCARELNLILQES